MVEGRETKEDLSESSFRGCRGETTQVRGAARTSKALQQIIRWGYEYEVGTGSG